STFFIKPDQSWNWVLWLYATESGTPTSTDSTMLENFRPPLYEPPELREALPKVSLTFSLTPVAAPESPAVTGESPSANFSAPSWAASPIALEPSVPELTRSISPVTLSPKPWIAFSPHALT